MTLAYPGECDKCNIVCLAVYQPVCAINLQGIEQQFGNQCELDGYNCRNPNNRK